MTTNLRRAHPLSVSLLIVAVLLLTVTPALARWRLDGAGGCGQFADSVAAAEPGDVLAPMRGGVNTQSVAITQTLVIQGGWLPESGDCTSNGTDQFNTQAAVTAAGFSYDPAQRSSLFGDVDSAVLPIALTGGRTAVLQNLEMSFGTTGRSGLALSGVISDGARLRLENLRFESNLAGAVGGGGAVSLEVRGGSQLVIANSEFINNNAQAGGALEVRLYDGSTLLVEGSTFADNTALGENGGALRVLIERGSATLRGNSFTNNSAASGSGGAVAVERAPGATGTATLLLDNNTFSGNTAAETDDLYAAGVAALQPRLRLPLLAGSPATSLAVRITGITLSEAAYAVAFTTTGYTPQLPGRHVHFFFNTVPPAQAGVPGRGPWVVYGGASPFRGYDIADRPKGATQLCALVANPDHSVIQGTGNCVSLP